MYEKTKTIVCLAASARDGGICIAGKEYNNGIFGDWIRPVSNRENRSILNPERIKDTGGFTQVLDVVTVFLNSSHPYGHHSENHIIENGQVWVNRGRLTKTDIMGAMGAIDDVTGLWHDGYSSSGGTNDRVPLKYLGKMQSSLLLIEPENLIITNINTRSPRATFDFQGISYNLAMTDPIIKEKYRANSCHSFPDALICVSLAETFRGYAYKLVAAVIE